MASKEGLDINCQVLLEHQADPNAYGNDQYHKTPIHRARSPKVKSKLIIGLVLTNKVAVGFPSCIAVFHVSRVAKLLVINLLIRYY